jgi:hypothetical protein
MNGLIKYHVIFSSHFNELVSQMPNMIVKTEIYIIKLLIQKQLVHSTIIEYIIERYI